MFTRSSRTPRISLQPADDDPATPHPDNFKEMLGIFLVVVIAVAVIVTALVR